MLKKRLEELRIEKGMTRKKVAAHLRIDQSTYGKYELGKREPDYDILRELAELYNTSVDYLLGRTNIRTPIETIATHHNEDEWTEEEREDIEAFKEFVRMRREQKKNR
ncbi:MAG TPA: helix-turn-helix transcriptional regulator [Clostridia bacterium]|nr:helix-turn-helix transcriptional regulator [Clostridia bacterium]